MATEGAQFDPIRAVGAADAFMRAASIIEESAVAIATRTQTAPLLYIPIPVLHAHALELYVNALTGIRGSEIRRGHNVWAKYSRFPLEVKQSIEALYDDLVNQSPLYQAIRAAHPSHSFDIRSTLTQVESVVRHYRYIYESDADMVDTVGIEEAAGAVRQYILDVHGDSIKRQGQ